MAHDNDWHLDKRLSIGHIVTTLTVLIGIMLYATDMDKRLSLQEQRLESLNAQYHSREQALNKRLDKIDEKLDRLIERNIARK